MQSLAVKTAAWMVAMLIGMGLAVRNADPPDPLRPFAPLPLRPSATWVRPARTHPTPPTATTCPLELLANPQRDLILRRAGEATIYVTRAFVDRALEQQAELMRCARIVPEVRDGKTVGVRIFGVKAESSLARLGFENGDVLLRVSGYDMASPDGALEAYAKLRERSELDVEIIRNGRWMVLRYVLC